MSGKMEEKELKALLEAEKQCTLTDNNHRNAFIEYGWKKAMMFNQRNMPLALLPTQPGGACEYADSIIVP
jgi:hypothetical protein